MVFLNTAWNEVEVYNDLYLHNVRQSSFQRRGAFGGTFRIEANQTSKVGLYTCQIAS